MMKLDEDEVIPRKTALTMLIAADSILMIFAVCAFLTRDFVYVLLLIITCPVMVPITVLTIVGELERSHIAKYKEVLPLSAYSSIQVRAQEFLELAVPKTYEKN